MRTLFAKSIKQRKADLSERVNRLLPLCDALEADTIKKASELQIAASREMERIEFGIFLTQQLMKQHPLSRLSKGLAAGDGAVSIHQTLPPRLERSEILDLLQNKLPPLLMRAQQLEEVLRHLAQELPETNSELNMLRRFVHFVKVATQGIPLVMPKPRHLVPIAVLPTIAAFIPYGIKVYTVLAAVGLSMAVPAISMFRLRKVTMRRLDILESFEDRKSVV